MKRHRFGVILHPDIPKALLLALKGYVFDDKPNSLPFLISDSFENNGAFHRLEPHHVDDAKRTSSIQLPTQYVLVVYEMDEGESPLGFLQAGRPKPKKK